VDFTLVTAADGVGLDADVVVDARSLRTGLAARDERLRAMLAADRWPDIVARFRGVDPAVVEATHRLPFALTIRDVTRRVEAVVMRWARGERDLALDAEMVVSLRDFGLEAPSVLGLVRVGDVVRVRARVAVVPPEPAG
jgi:polyisoprenoid-binding protein YceI